MVKVLGPKVKWPTLVWALEHKGNGIIEDLMPQEDTKQSLAEAILTVHARELLVLVVVLKSQILDVVELLSLWISIHGPDGAHSCHDLRLILSIGTTDVELSEVVAVILVHRNSLLSQDVVVHQQLANCRHLSVDGLVLFVDYV